MESGRPFETVDSILSLRVKARLSVSNGMGLGGCEQTTPGWRREGGNKIEFCCFEYNGVLLTVEPSGEVTDALQTVKIG